MEAKLEFAEIDLETVKSLASFYAMIPEFGKKNILSNEQHLEWKHLDNPAGKSIVASLSVEKKIVGAMIFQKQFRIYENKMDLYFLATDFAIAKKYRSLKLVLDFWKNCLKHFNENFEEIPLIHSSNKKSEKIYSFYFKNHRKEIIKPAIYWPKRDKTFETNNTEELVKFTDEQYLKWRFASKSQRKYIKFYNAKNEEIIFAGIIKKIFGLKFLIIIDVNPKFLETNIMQFRYNLLITCIKNFAICPIFYVNENLRNKDIDYRRHFKILPTIISPFSFPIYIHNNVNLLNKNLILKLSAIDVL